MCHTEFSIKVTNSDLNYTIFFISSETYGKLCSYVWDLLIITISCQHVVMGYRVVAKCHNLEVLSRFQIRVTIMGGYIYIKK